MTKLIATLLILITINWSSILLGRSLYLNGQDISSARNQSLEKVDIKIDQDGTIYIEAPQYKVNEENTYIPLSKMHHPARLPSHKAPGPLSTKLSSPAPETPPPPGDAVKKMGDKKPPSPETDQPADGKE